MYLASNSSALLIGPSGGQYVGCILNKPTLIFDWASFFSDHYHPLLYYLPSKLTGPEGIIHCQDRGTYRSTFANILPHNGITINKKGYKVSTLDQSSLALGFEHFMASMI